MNTIQEILFSNKYKYLVDKVNVSKEEFLERYTQPHDLVVDYFNKSMCIFSSTNINFLYTGNYMTYTVTCKNCNTCTNCKNCDNCIGCRDCNDLHNCYDCYACNSCSNILNCNHCKSCVQCSSCDNCNNCNQCKFSVLLNDCNRCSVCYACSKINNTVNERYTNVNTNDKHMTSLMF